MDPKTIIEFLRGNLDISTLPENERKDLLSGLREDHSKNQTELVARAAEIEQLTEKIENLSQSVETLTADKESLENELKAYEELEKQRVTVRREQLLSEIEEEMKLIGREMDEEQKTKLDGFEIEYLETFLSFLKDTPVNLSDLSQKPPKGEGSVEEGTESDPTDVYGKDHGSKKPVTTLYNAEKFGKSEYR